MTHEESQQLAALAAIGAATPEEAAELRHHLQECAECRAAADELDEAAALLALTVDAVAPPSGVRARVIRKISGEDRVPTMEKPLPRPPSRWWLIAMAAMLLVIVGQNVFQIRELRYETAQLRADKQKLSETIAALSTSGARTIQLAGQPVAPNASARVFLDPAHRRAFVFFDQLPPNPGDKSYQLWIIRADQVAPQSAGVFNVDRNGKASLVVENLPVDTLIKAIAVTLEPKGGAPAPTGEKYLVGT